LLKPSTPTPLAAVRLYVEINKPGDLGTFSLMTPFPKKVFQDEDYEKPLDKLGKYFVLSHVLYITTVCVAIQQQHIMYIYIYTFSKLLFHQILARRLRCTKTTIYK
jgi:hypothetical protein